MIPIILALPAVFALPAPAAPTLLTLQEETDEYDTKLAEAGDDVERLWELQAWCKEQGRNSDRRRVLQKIVKADPNHEQARKSLGHHFYDEKWFSTRTELSAYRRAEERRMLEQGLVRHGDQWIKKEAAPFLRMGWSKDEQSGKWMSPSAIEASTLKARFEAENYQQQDLTWIHPDEFPKWEAGLWKCGEEWLSAEQANEYHAELTQPWHFPSVGGHFEVVSTCPRGAVEWAGYWADKTVGDLVAIFGKKPEGRTKVYVLKSIDQYNQVAAGDQGAGRPAAESTGWSSCHHAFFADTYFSGNPPEFLGGGICYYDVTNDKLRPFGQHAIRHAAALSYLDAIDPSWDSVSRLIEAFSSGAGGGAGGGTDFWSEKAIPMWLRFGAATYVERYFVDGDAEAGRENWARDWSIGNLAGQLRPAKEIFAFNLDPASPEASAKLLNEAGLVVSFIRHGGIAEVTQAHGAFKAKFRAGESTDEAIEALQEALIKNEAAMRKYAGISG